MSSSEIQSIEQFLLEYERQGGKDPLAYRAAVPLILPTLLTQRQDRGGRRAKTAGERLHDWFRVEKQLRASDRPTLEEAYPRAGVSSSVYHESKKCPLVQALLRARERITDLGGDDVAWWASVTELASQWEALRDQQRLAAKATKKVLK